MNPLNAIPKKIQDTLRDAQIAWDSTILVALSGGLDSQVLTHALLRIDQSDRPIVRAVHVDHQLRERSADDARAVVDLCHDWGVPIDVMTVDVSRWSQNHGQGIEAAARAARYAALAQVYRDTDASAILTAHHLDDHVETVMLRLLSGASLDSLSGIRADSSRRVELQPITTPGEALVETIRLLRPLLRVSRADLETYAAHHSLRPIEDETNVSLDYRRNQIRHEIVPRLTAIEPGFPENLARMSDLVADDAAYLNTLARRWVADHVRAGEIWRSFSRDDFAEAPPVVQRRVLISLAHSLVDPLRLSAERVDAVRQAVVAGRVGSQIELPGELVAYVDYSELVMGFAARIHRDLLRRYGRPLLYDGQRIEHPGNELVDNGWQIHVSAEDTAPRWVIRERQPGDRIQLAGRPVATLKQWFIDNGVPQYVRERVPLLVVDGHVRWIAGVTGKTYRSPEHGLQVSAIRPEEREIS